jgi:hypothetical protein
VVRQSDRFTWPLIAERILNFRPSDFEIESGEKQAIDFEFVTPSDVRAVRVYAYLRNEQKSKEGRGIGWAASSYYDFYSATGGIK